MKVKLNETYITGNELKYIKDIIENRLETAGDGIYTHKATKLLEKRYAVNKVFLTTSGSTALEFAVRLCGFKPGDEIIVPSFTFSSTINAVLLIQGLKVVFADITKDTLNIDPEDIKKKINKKTKGIIVVHYAGVACDMDAIMKIAKQNNLKVIEDAAQALESKHKGKYLGTIGDYGCVSFHGTKNISSGEGGALFINRRNKKLLEKAEVIREKGTNRTRFLLGLVDKYTWMDVGSSYLPSDILSAYLYAQLEEVGKITNLRREKYDYYATELSTYKKLGLIKLPVVPSYAHSNAHIFYVLFSTEAQRNFVLNYLRDQGVGASFHYIPLHSSPFGKKLGHKSNSCPITEELSRCLLRLPIYSHISKEKQNYVIKKTKEALEMLMTRHSKIRYKNQEEKAFSGAFPNTI